MLLSVDNFHHPSVFVEKSCIIIIILIFPLYSACYVERAAEESMNDRNDATIRLAAWWFSTHLQSLHIKAVLLTDDASCKSKALNMDVIALGGE